MNSGLKIMAAYILGRSPSLFMKMSATFATSSGGGLSLMRKRQSFIEMN